MEGRIRIDIVSIFPEAFASFASTSILRRAILEGRLEMVLHDIRNSAEDLHRTVDDLPYGGGAGMVMKAGPIIKTIKDVPTVGGRVLKIYLSPQGVPFTQRLAHELATYEQLVLLCGHYEGVDQRAIDTAIDMEISIGDYVLTGGELPALVMVDAVSRLIKGVLGNSESDKEESFENMYLEYPHYTRPAELGGAKVPEVLLTGDHKKIKEWRSSRSLDKTRRVRPDLLKKM